MWWRCVYRHGSINYDRKPEHCYSSGHFKNPGQNILLTTNNYPVFKRSYMNVQAHGINKVMIIALLCLAASLTGYSKNKILGVKVSFPGDNVLSVQLEVTTADVLNVSIEYWVAGQK